MVNEPFNEDGTRRRSVFQTVFGDSCIADALRAARAADPAAKLYVDGCNVEGVNAKSAALCTWSRTWSVESWRTGCLRDLPAGTGHQVNCPDRVGSWADGEVADTVAFTSTPPTGRSTRVGTAP
ncbi:endo-1,4-beta-xylanase [Streptomyces sp. NPDC050982]|uniref:endo-1,4-beta-xylanase n=1 Tax=Streptomyces sp. NPDC050982 TaxID=3154746 RepID=UPI0034108523